MLYEMEPNFKRYASEALQQLARLHYRHRFDPAGLPAAEREILREQALAWLAQHPAQA
jgi:hypothetical protein